MNSWDAFRSEPLFDEFYATIWCPIDRSRVPIPDKSQVFRNALLNAFLDRATYLHFLHDGINLGKLYEWMPQELWEEIFSEDERVQIISNCRNRLNSSIEQGIREVLGEWTELDDFPVRYPSLSLYPSLRTTFFKTLILIPLPYNRSSQQTKLSPQHQNAAERPSSMFYSAKKAPTPTAGSGQFARSMRRQFRLISF